MSMFKAGRFAPAGVVRPRASSINHNEYQSATMMRSVLLGKSLSLGQYYAAVFGPEMGAGVVEPKMRSHAKRSMSWESEAISDTSYTLCRLRRGRPIHDPTCCD